MATIEQKSYLQSLAGACESLGNLCDGLEDGFEYDTYSMVVENEGLSRERADEVLEYIKTLRHIAVALDDMKNELEEDWGAE